MGRDRDLGLDAARGLAVLSMFVAHFAPAAGPGEVLVLSEYLTAPLFVLLIGAGAELGKRSVHRWRANQVRATVLVALGVLLTAQFPSGIVVVLVWLGLVTLVATWLAELPVWALGVTGVAVVVLEPVLMREAADWLVTTPVDDITRVLVQVTLTGQPYRLTAFLLPACVGILLVRLATSTGRRYAVAVGGLGVAAVLFLLDQSGSALLVPYSGTRQELAFSSALSVGLAALVWALAPRVKTLARGLAAIGLVALTVYVAQVLADWAYLKQAPDDDSWALLAAMSAGSLALGLAWIPVRRATGWRGPLEGPVDLLARGRRSGS